MSSRNNAAGRLHKVLSKAVQQGNVSTLHAWACALEVPVEDKSEVFRRIFALHQLVDEVKLRVSAIGGINSGLYLSRWTNIENVVKATNYDASWDGYKPQLSEAAMLNLEHCAEVLHMFDERPLDENDLAELSKDISALFDNLTDSKIPVELKEVILDQLESIRRSIAEYRLRGASGIRDEVAYCYGKFLQSYGVFEENKASAEVQSLWRILARADNVTTVALNVMQLSSHALKLIGCA